MEILKEIWISASRNKLRTCLTGFSVAWGVFMLIVLLGAGNGLINAQYDHMNTRIPNSMKVFGGETSKPYNGLREGRNIQLHDGDIEVSKRAFPDKVDIIGAEITSDMPQNISYAGRYVAPTLRGVTPEYIEIEKFKLLYGRFINALDIRDERKVILLSSKMSRELCKNDSMLLGKYVRVNNFAFKVVGIYREDESKMEVMAYTPITTFKTLYNKGNMVGSLNFTVNNVTTEDEDYLFESDYRSVINCNHNAAPDDESAVWYINHNMGTIIMLSGINIIRTALWIIGLLTLLSGIVGISNIMLITVKERTHELGIRKTLGATPWSILKLIIIESIITIAIFGYIGMICGIAANEYMNVTIGRQVLHAGVFQATMFLNPTVGLGTCIEVTLIMILAGTIAGIIPASKAAKIKPIEALREE